MADANIEVPAGQGVISVEDVYPEEADVVGLGEKDRLGFAKQILFWLFAFSIFVIVSSQILVVMYSADAEVIALVDTILDITKTVVPSTVTLVLGFYFGKASGNAGGNG